MSRGSGWEGQVAPGPARVSSRSCVQPGTPELPLLLWPLAPPKPDAPVTLALPSPTSPVLCWHVACRCLQAPNSAPRQRETGPEELPPVSLPPAAPLSFGSPSPRTPQGAQPARSRGKGNVLCLTFKALGGRGPACHRLALVA